MLDRLSEAGIRVTTVGKIDDIYDHRGMTDIMHLENNADAQQATLAMIQEGRNGLIFPQNDVGALAAAITRLLDDPRQFRTMRENVLQTRDRFSYDEATAVWDPWLSSLVD